MESLYDVCFAGELLEGRELESVRNNIQKLFKANPETLEKLFSGKVQLLKRGCDKSTAIKYQQAMERAGAVAIVRAGVSTGAYTASGVENTDDAASSKPGETSDSGLDLAPVGSDVLRPDERISAEPVEIDTSRLDLAAVGSVAEQSSEPGVPPPDTSHLSVASAGEIIPGLITETTPLNPNTDNIELSPEGTDFSDCAPPAAAAPELDLSSIEIAPAGADVLEEQYKKTDRGTAPNTDHLSLAE